MFLPFNDAVVGVSLLDRNHQILADSGDTPVILSDPAPMLSGPATVPFELRYRRQRRLFGSRRTFFHGIFLVDIECKDWKRCAHVVLDIVPIDAFKASIAKKTLWWCEPDCIHVEMSHKKLATPGRTASFLLISKEQAAKRMKRILKKQPALCGESHAAASAASNLMVKLFHGGDTPLLTEKI